MKSPRKKPIELKPCPFCNGNPEMVPLPYFREFFVRCKKCKVEQGHCYKTEKSAAQAWNRRDG